MISIEHDREHYLVCRVSGTVTKSDIEGAVPQIENELDLRKGRLRLMVVLENFHGWEVSALWEELRFDAGHAEDLGRIAVLGDSASEDWGVALAKPFFGSQMRYFPLEDRASARAWLNEGRGGTSPATER